jgi:hypothetical protein
MNENLKVGLIKLDKSKCINLLIDKYRDHYKNHLLSEMHSNIITKCIGLKS